VQESDVDGLVMGNGEPADKIWPHLKYGRASNDKCLNLWRVDGIRKMCRPR
jgi:hypothetical protein